MILGDVDLAGTSEFDADICVIGSGAAGLSFAREFIDSKWRIAVIAGGDREFDPEWQELYKGLSVGRPFAGTETDRLRQFGGTTNHWHGLCRSLDPIDFERGWPFPYEDLIPFYQRAHELCQLGPFEYRPSYWQSQTNQLSLPFDQSLIETIFFQYSPPTAFGEVYELEFARSSNVAVYLNISALELDTSENGAQVREVTCTTLDAKIIKVKARHFVLACGGLENPRILLNSNRYRSSGVGNEAGLVGRYLMEHPRRTTGRIIFSDPFLVSLMYEGAPTNVSRLGIPSKEPLEILASLALPSAVLRQEEINNLRFRLDQSYEKSHEQRVQDAKRSGRRLLNILTKWEGKNRFSDQLDTFVENVDAAVADALGFRQKAYPMANMYDVVTLIEQSPYEFSQVRLGDERDALASVDS